MFIKFGNTSGKENSQMWYNIGPSPLSSYIQQLQWKFYSDVGRCSTIHSFSISVPTQDARLFDKYWNALCLRPGWNWNTLPSRILLNICLKSFISDQQVSSILFITAGYLVVLIYNIWHGCMHFPTLEIAFSILLAPRPCTASLHNLFKCSMCKSDSMLCPAIPHVFMNLEFKSCWAWHGGNRKWYWRSSRGASIK